MPAADRVGGGVVAEQPVSAWTATAETRMGMGMETVVEAVAPGVEAPGVEAGGLTLANMCRYSANALGTPANSRTT